MWKDISGEWKEAFEQAWLAFCNGSLPIGAVIADACGNTIIAGRNETCESRYPNSRTAHAEMYCMRNIDIAKFPDLKDYHLYTTMEPCPMCMGTIVMGGIRKVHVAARDGYCGALHYLQYDPWMRGKNVEVYPGEREMEAVQLAQQGYHELRRFDGTESSVLEQFQRTCPEAVRAARAMFQERYLDKCVQKKTPCCEVYDHICALISQMST